MAIAVYFLHNWLRSMAPLFQLVILPVVGGLIYVSAIWFTNREVARKGIDMLRHTFSKRTKPEIGQ